MTDWADKASVAAWHKKYRAENIEYIQAQRAAGRAADPEKYRAQKRRSAGVPEAGGLAPHGPCEICGKECVFVLDHDHATRIFRGWLCTNCNTALGKLGDTVAGLERAITYLKKER